MTNNPTIDGVSPPVNCRQRMAAEGKPYPRSSCEVCGQFSPKWRECDALIDADKVNNRQMGLMQFVETHPVAPAVERQPIKNASEVAYNLQAENARLEARITQLESEKEFAAATHQAARDRIADLESGRIGQIGMLLIDEYFDNREIGEVDVQLDSEACEKLARDFPGQSLPVFVGPTALPERKPVTVGLFSESNTHNQGWNARLDATAALNGVKS